MVLSEIEIQKITKKQKIHIVVSFSSADAIFIENFLFS